MKRVCVWIVSIVMVCTSSLFLFACGPTGSNGSSSGSNTTCTSHNYVVIENHSATCTARGYKRYACTKCGAEYREDLQSLGGHQYVESDVASTCITKGYTLHSCSRCGHSYTSDEKELSMHSGVWNCSTCQYNFFIGLKAYIYSNGTYKDSEYVISINLNDIVQSKNNCELLLKCNPSDDIICWDYYDYTDDYAFSITIPNTFRYVFVIQGNGQGKYNTFWGNLYPSNFKDATSLTYTYTNLSSTYASLISAAMEMAAIAGRYIQYLYFWL